VNLKAGAGAWLARDERRGRARCLGALLMEALVALAVFLMAGIGILALMHQGRESMRRADELVRACDLARSAMARLECGLAGVTELDGPASLWGAQDAATIGHNTPASDEWMIEVQTRRSGVDGLTAVTIVARKENGRDAPGEVSYTLRQHVRLGREQLPDAAPEDAISEGLRQ